MPLGLPSPETIAGFTVAPDVVNSATHGDIDTMEKLLDGGFFRDADDFTNWLDLASHALRIGRHPDVLDMLEDYR